MNSVGKETMAIDAESSPKVTSIKAEAPASTHETRPETIDGMEVNGMSQRDIEMQQRVMYNIWHRISCFYRLYQFKRPDGHSLLFYTYFNKGDYLLHAL